MQKYLKISGVALMAAMLATLPAGAVSINLGGAGNGGGLINSGSTGPDATVSVDTNNLLDGGDANAVVRTNLLNGAADDDATARLNLGSGNGDLLDLFGDGNDPATARVTLGGNGTGGNDADVLVNLFGDGSGTDTTAQLTLGGNGAGNAGGPGGEAISPDVPDIFGAGEGSGPTTGSDENGSAGGSGAHTVGTIQLAAANIGAGSNCFTPNANQMTKLVNRHSYVDATLSAWASAGQLKVVDVGLCADAGSSIAADTNISRLQAFVSAHATLREGLGKLGHQPQDIIGADKTGDTLTVYVM